MTIQLTSRERSALRKALLRKGIKTVGMDNDAIIKAGVNAGVDPLDGILPPTPLDAPDGPVLGDPGMYPDAPDHTALTPEKAKRRKRAPVTPEKYKGKTADMIVIDDMVPSDDAAALAAILARMAGGAAPIDADAVKAIVKAEMNGFNAPKIVKIQPYKAPKPGPDMLVHKDFETILKAMSTRTNLCIVGPAGSGKTYAAEQAAKALDQKFYFSGAVPTAFKLLGFVDATGTYQPTPFHEAFKDGGVFCLDELDASSPDAILALNAMLAGAEYGDFPHGMVKRHEDFYCVATANTFGQGASREYVGRNQLDASSLTRFNMLYFGYDEALERAFSGDDRWTSRVQELRASAAKHNIRIVISPRASKDGAALLKQGLPQKLVEDMTIFKGIDENQKRKILGAA